MNRTALQNYFSMENFAQILLETQGDIEKHGVDFLVSDKLAFDGILHRVELLGEIAKNITEECKKENPEISWNDIARTRDLITHHYHRIDAQVIRKILTDDLSVLLAHLLIIRQRVFENLNPEDQKDVKKM